MSKLTPKQMESHLWESANILRGSIDSSDYKNYVFGMVFLKRKSEIFHDASTGAVVRLHRRGAD